MATQVEERRQRLVEINERIRTFEGRLQEDQDWVPSAEEESEHEAMYNARADIRADLDRISRMNARAQANRGSAGDDIPEVIRRGGTGAAGNGNQELLVSLGDRFVQASEYRDWLASHNGRMPTDRNAHIRPMDAVRIGGLMDLGIRSDLVTGGSNTSGGAFITPDRMTGFVDLGRRPLNILDFISVVRTESDLIEFVRQTARTNNAATVLEATDSSGITGVKPESSFAFEVVQEPVTTIANWMPATRQAVADVPQMRDLINTELRENVREELEDQIIAGNGTDPNMLGIINTSGVQTQAWDTDILTTTRRARTKVRTVGRSVPTAYGMHPNDWEDIDLLQDNEARYYFGGPSVVGTPRLWGLPVFENEAFTEGQAIVAEWRFARLWDREDTQLFVSDSHADFFIRNLLAILAEMRAAFAVLRPAAFVLIDLVA